MRLPYPSQAHEAGVSPDMSFIPPTPAPGGSHSGSYLATPAVRQVRKLHVTYICNAFGV